MTIKERLEKLLSEFHDECIEVLDIHSTADEILELFTQSKIKEKLYQGIIKRELKDKYEEGRYGTQCKTCGTCGVVEEGILVHKHYRRCPTAQMERIIEL